MTGKGKMIICIVVMWAICIMVTSSLGYRNAFSQPTSKTVTVNIEAGSGKSAGSVAKPFDPLNIFVHKGDTVNWVNQDSANHSIVALGIDSGIIQPKGSTSGPSTFTHKFEQEGTYVYIDKLHPYMGGVIYVDVPVTQRELVSTTGSFVKVNVEMPQNAAYENNFGPFFIPADAHITAGSPITWTNKDYVSHTATSGDGSSFDTKTILPSESVTLQLKNKGFFTYYCKIHPWMIGSVTVS
jgi:plastocyanin